MKTHITEIKTTLENRGIILKNTVDDTEKYTIKDSVTNQFLKVEDIAGNMYLVRLNGKLWPPFTRENETHNLAQLKLKRINTQVIHNNPDQGYQISRLDSETNRFSAFKNEDRNQHILKNVAREIKNYHQLKTFKNVYDVQSTVISSFNRNADDHKKNLNSSFHIISRLLTYLNADTKNKVSSHNDLLPSSVYVRKNAVSFVDWEYSGENHRSYDLALFSIKSSLTPKQEQTLVTAYDPNNNDDTQHAVVMMKPVISFLLLLWNREASLSAVMFVELANNLQHAIAFQAIRNRKVSVDYPISAMKPLFFNRNHRKEPVDILLTSEPASFNFKP